MKTKAYLIKDISLTKTQLKDILLVYDNSPNKFYEYLYTEGVSLIMRHKTLLNYYIYINRSENLKHSRKQILQVTHTDANGKTSYYDYWELRGNKSVWLFRNNDTYIKCDIDALADALAEIDRLNKAFEDHMISSPANATIDEEYERIKEEREHFKELYQQYQEQTEQLKLELLQAVRAKTNTLIELDKANNKTHELSAEILTLRQVLEGSEKGNNSVNSEMPADAPKDAQKATEKRRRGKPKTYTDEQRVDIKARVAAGEPIARVARDYGCIRATIYRIIKEE